MEKSVENSLRSLKVDVIDILQLHDVSTEEQVTNGPARELMQRLLDQKKIRMAGVTTHEGQEVVLDAVVKHGFYKTVLVAYNFRTDVGVKAAIKNTFRTGKGLTATIQQAASAGVGVIAMKTQAGGYSIPGRGLSPHQAALAWVLENPGVAMAIPSMVSFAHVDENLGARGKRLSLGGRMTLRRYAASIEDRHCGLCGMCTGICPRGVHIQGVLRSLTYYEGYREKELASGAYRSLPPSADAAACISCPECVVACPLGLSVGRLARETHRILTG